MIVILWLIAGSYIACGYSKWCLSLLMCWHYTAALACYLSCCPVHLHRVVQTSYSHMFLS